MTRSNAKAHAALLDWSSWLMNHNTTQDLGYQMADFMSTKVNTPPKALIPRIAFTSATVIYVSNWYMGITPILRRNVIRKYFQKEEIGKRREEYIWEKLSPYLQNCAFSKKRKKISD